MHDVTPARAQRNAWPRRRWRCAASAETDTLFTQGLRSNLPLAGAVLSTFVLQMAVIYVPALQEVFHTQALSAGELAACLGCASVVFIAVEVEKWLRRRRR